ncbi:MAG TPA: MFS transporter [Drouetiella sp.]
MSVSQETADQVREHAVTAKVPVGLFAIAAGVMITNMFAPQTLIGPMSASLEIKTSDSGLIAMVSLLGYAAGLFFMVPLADLVENRSLSLRMIAVATLSAALIPVAPNAPVLFFLLFFLGVMSSAIQVMMPLAASLAEPDKRGQVLGDIMSGVMIGILLARPAASFLAGVWGWKAYYAVSSSVMTLLLLALIMQMPKRVPEIPTTYSELIGSLWHLLSTENVLLRRSFSAAIVMAGFNFFWTTIAFVLSFPPFNFNQFGVAAFALAGAGGALVTPLVGRLADQGYGSRVTTFAHISLVVGFALAALSVSSTIPVSFKVAALVFSALLLDTGVLGDQTVGRYLINQLRPEARGRINGIFVGIFFVGGAIGSAVSAMVWTSGGWNAICATGAFFGILASLTRKPSYHGN